MTTRNDFSAVPAALRSLENWLVWRYEDVCNKAGVAKRAKVPYNAKTGHKASSTNYKTWCDFSKAVEVFEAGHGDGIGFVVTHAAGFVGVDLDHCYDAASDTVAEWASAIVTALNSYTEITPSGTGLRVFVRGALPETGRKKGDFEIYNNQRFLTITGQHLPGTPLEIHERPAEILTIHQQIFGKPAPRPAVTVNGHASAPIGSDMEILSAMFAAKNGAKVRALWHGDIAAYASQSEADGALCFHLAFWLRRDAARMDALFRQSSLMRPKWDEKHHADGQTYGGRTIAEACARTTQQYEPPRPVFLNGPGARAYIGGQNEEHAEAIDAAADAAQAEADDEAPGPQPDEDPDAAPLDKGLYRVHKGRLLMLVEKEKSTETGGEITGKKSYIADMSAHIFEVTRDEDGAQLFVATGREQNGRRFTAEFDALKFTDPKYVAGQLSNATSPACVFYAGMEKHLAPSIRSFTDMDRVKITRQFHRVGWASNETEYIIPGMEAKDVTITLSRDLPYGVVAPEPGQQTLSDGAQQSFNALLRAHNPTLTTLSICYALLAPLSGLAGWRDDRFGLFIAGRTGTFKTSFACMILCLYGDFPNEDKMLKFGQGATLNAMLAQSAIVRDMVMGIDNFKPGTGTGQKDAQGFIHGALEGGERKRLNRDGTRRTSKEVYVWPMMTGEDTLDDAASVARMIIINAEWKGIENPQLTAAQSLCHHSPEIGGYWLHWIQNESVRAALKAATRQVPERRAAWATLLRKLHPDMVNASRVASSLTLLEMCWGIAISCPAFAPILQPFTGEFEAGLRTVAGNMGQYAAQTHEANRYIGALRAMLDGNRAYLLPKHMDADKDDRRLFLGWEDDDTIYLQPEIAYVEILKFLRDAGGLNGLGPSTIHKQLDQLGYISRKREGHLTAQKRVGTTNKGKNLLWLYRAKIVGTDADEEAESDL